MKVRFTSLKKAQRSGFTLIELLVVISIIAVLAALILPGIQNARAAASRINCLNNMKNVGVAVQVYATSNRGAVPPLAGKREIPGHSTGSSPWQIRRMSWMANLLPMLDNTALYDRIQTRPDGGGPDELDTLAGTNIEVFTCPSDTRQQGLGRTSFVGNAGYAVVDRMSVTGSGWQRLSTIRYPAALALGATPAEQRQLSAKMQVATGVFFHDDSPNTGSSINGESLTVTLDSISAGDGLSQTLMISENLNTRAYSPSGNSGGWMSDSIADVGFVLPVAGSVSNSPTLDTVSDGSNPGGIGGATSATALIQNDTRLTVGQINNNAGAAIDGQAPRPSSLHPGVVNVVMSDGSARNISENIDGTVYGRLISSNGNKFGQLILSSNDY